MLLIMCLCIVIHAHFIDYLPRGVLVHLRMHSAHGHQQVYHSFSSMYFVVKLPVLPMLKIHDSHLLAYILHSITQNDMTNTPAHGHLTAVTPLVRCNTLNITREDKGRSLP